MGRHTWKEYALYKGDEYLDCGDINELSQKWGVNKRYLRWLASANRMHTYEHNRHGYIMIRIEDDDDE